MFHKLKNVEENINMMKKKKEHRIKIKMELPGIKSKISKIKNTTDRNKSI